MNQRQRLPLPALAWGARRRAEVLEHCRDGEVSHALDLAFEHLAAHGPDRSLLCALCRAASRLDAVTRARLEELILSHHPDPRDAPEPCIALREEPGP